VIGQSTADCHAIDDPGIRDMKFSRYRDIACNLLTTIDAGCRLDKKWEIRVIFVGPFVKSCPVLRKPIITLATVSPVGKLIY
jgi:hypothetical protein